MCESSIHNTSTRELAFIILIYDCEWFFLYLFVCGLKLVSRNMYDSVSTAKHKHGKALKSHEKDIIHNIYLTLKANSLSISARDIGEKASNIANVSIRSVFNIIVLSDI